MTTHVSPPAVQSQGATQVHPTAPAGRLNRAFETLKEGLAAMFAAVGPNVTSATLEDQVGATSLTGAAAFAETKLTLTGDPAAVGQIQAAIDKAKQDAQVAIAKAKEETERARITTHSAGHDARH